jgi:DNA-binding SARP family transcriptional activator/tetratricopeptide (TPR) repeat protein
MAAAHGIHARLLGSFDVAIDGVRVERGAFERPSGLRLLKLLLATPGHRIRREAAAEALWPEMDPDRSGANLRKAIHFARRGLGTSAGAVDGLLVVAGDVLALAVSPGSSIDVDELSAAIESTEAGTGSATEPGTLIRLGNEELLPEEPYEEWLVPLRERLSQRALAALARAAAAARADGDRSNALRLIDVLLIREPADEAANRLAIELHLEAGELHAARRRLRQCRAAMAEAYGVEPDPALDRLLAEAAARRPAGRSAIPSEAPIVGRTRELSATESAFDHVAGGRSAAILVRGPAGIGKSRVLRELVAQARASGWRVIEARGLESSPGEPFAAIAAAVAEGAGEDRASLSEAARSAVQLAAPGSGRAPAVPTMTFGSDSGMTAALVEAIQGLALEAPVALAIDDAQWLDDRSLGVLAALVGREHRTDRVLTIVSVRDDPALVVGGTAELLAALDDANAHEAPLGPLGPREIQALLEREVEGERVDDDVSDRIAELAGGVPLFALEIFRLARATGLVERRDGPWSRRRGVDALPVPPGVTRLVERRVGRLGPAARRVLATAAELADVVTFEDLVATGVDADAVLDAVDLALAEGIVVEIAGRYAFAHPLYRAALRTGLRPRDRGDIHRRIASTLAAGIPATDAEVIRRAGATGLDLGFVAMHAAEAVALGRREAVPLAVGFGLAAGERQALLFDHIAAAATIRRALRIWQRMPEAERSAYPISRAQVELGRALRRSGDDADAAAAFRAAVVSATNDDEVATAYAAAASLSYEHGRFEAALETLGEGLARVTAPIPRAALDTDVGWILGREGRWSEAEPILLRAVEVLEPSAPSAVLMRALDHLSIAIGARDPAASLPVVERAMAMARELGRTGELATYEMHFAGSLRHLGRLDEAVAALDRARVLSRQAGEDYIAAVTEWVSAEVRQTRGELRAAIDHRRRELEIFARIGGNPRHEALAHAHIAHLAVKLGDTRMASFEADAARALARHSGTPDLGSRVEWALGADDWFADQPVWQGAGQPVAAGNAAGTAEPQPASNG